MAVQGVAPSLWGPLSDTHGRRITFLSTFAVYLVATICLAFSKSLAGLMVFRALQAAGSAATISVGAYSKAVPQPSPSAARLTPCSWHGRCWCHWGYHDGQGTRWIYGKLWRQ
ncbi:hypothetical protein B0T26DRAFT_99633 [Lasiosphaeria miniovina]|uniref:Major facilitator superfamily (MFS) profile domain-containing protein n=1 Tax=Lasiosphaeria miniovina TaxID=1954250 RepID=A0AA40EGY9_9PEZI|nr:uncharacterized protein B0T26DRAFT_99633 [Lasiosphaeria miniovina]KAK0735258.1 hypothetical protein B0T26DRAFT_99633 [Lasiosphaeria miniovina]